MMKTEFSMKRPSRKPLLAAVTVALAIALLLGAVLVQIAQAADSVSMAGGDPARSGVQPGPAPTGDLTAATLDDQTGANVLNPVVLGSTLYRVVSLPATPGTESGPRAIEAVDLAAGASLWTKQLPDGFGNPNTGFAIMNDLLFYVSSTYDQTAGESDALVAFSSADGSVRWSVPVGMRGGAVSGSPLVKDGIVYWVDLDGSAYAVIADTGKVLWTSTAAKAANSPFVDGGPNISGVVSGLQFALDDRQLYLSNSDGELAALSLKDGALAWRFDVGQRFGVTVGNVDPRVYGGGVFLTVSATDPSAADNAWFSVIAAINPTDGGVAWKQFLGQTATGIAIANGKAFVSLYREGIDGYDVAAYDLKSGESVWNYASKYIAAADQGLVIAGESAFVTGQGGFLLGLSLDGGSAKTLYEFPEGVPAAQSIFVSDGRIALTDFSGAIVVLSGE